MLTASMDRLTDFFDERSGKPITEDSHSPRQSKEFCAANEVSCSRKNTLLCSDEHNNPLFRRMLHIVGYSIHHNCL